MNMSVMGFLHRLKNLQEVPIDVISVWIDHFQKDEVYFINDGRAGKGF